MTNVNREILEAREAGARALNSLRQAESHLDSARGWGLLDMFGGGFFSTMLKRGRMDDARRCIQQAQYDLQAFSRELADVHLPSVELDGFWASRTTFSTDSWPTSWCSRGSTRRGSRSPKPSSAWRI